MPRPRTPAHRTARPRALGEARPASAEPDRRRQGSRCRSARPAPSGGRWVGPSRWPAPAVRRPAPLARQRSAVPAGNGVRAIPPRRRRRDRRALARVGQLGHDDGTVSRLERMLGGKSNPQACGERRRFIDVEPRRPAAPPTPEHARTSSDAHEPTARPSRARPRRTRSHRERRWRRAYSDQNCSRASCKRPRANQPAPRIVDASHTMTSPLVGQPRTSAPNHANVRPRGVADGRWLRHPPRPPLLDLTARWTSRATLGVRDTSRCVVRVVRSRSSVAAPRSRRAVCSPPRRQPRSPARPGGCRFGRAA